MAMMPTLLPPSRSRAASRPTSVDFPEPGTPVMPITCDLPARR
jgi:hypothetical protein